MTNTFILFLVIYLFPTIFIASRAMYIHALDDTSTERKLVAILLFITPLINLILTFVAIYFIIIERYDKKIMAKKIKFNNDQIWDLMNTKK